MKKLLSILLCLALVSAGFCGCTQKKQTVMTVGAAEIDNEIFAYFFDEVYSQTKQDGGDLNDTAAMIEAAVAKCNGYVGTVTQYEQFMFEMSPKEKLQIATETEEEWMLYGKYYSSVGISKQTVTKINTARVMRTSLLLYYFGEGREYEVSEAEIEYYFDQAYVEFKTLNGYLISFDEEGNSIPLSDTELTAVRADFESKRQQLASGTAISEFNNGQDVESSFVAVTSTAYPEGFLAKVAELKYDTPTIIETEEYIFIVIRLDAKTDSNYENYRTSYIETLRGEMLTDLLISIGKDFGVTLNENRISDVADSVIDIRNSLE